MAPPQHWKLLIHLAILAIIPVRGQELGARPPGIALLVNRPVKNHHVILTDEGSPNPFDLECQFEGVPKPELTWFKNGRVIDDSEPGIIFTSPNKLEFTSKSLFYNYVVTFWYVTWQHFLFF